MNTILEFLKNLIPWNKIREFLSQLYSHQPFALILAFSLAALAGALGWWYWHRSSEYEAIVRNTLWADMEATPQEYKGLEAFIFSTLKQTSDVDVRGEIKGEPLHQQFKEACQKLQLRLDDYTSKKDRQERVKEVKLKVAAGTNEGKILTDGNTPGFLFLPVYVLRTPLAVQEINDLDSAHVDANGKSKIIEPKLNADADLKEDVALTAYLREELQGLTTTPIIMPNSGKLSGLIKNTPTQVYIITKNGVNRIFNSQLKDPSRYYGTQFPATTFFPSRPYFWPAFQNLDTGNKSKQHQHWGQSFMPSAEETTVGEYFYVTQPYLDLAGNGIVITLSRGLLINGVVQAVLCFDLPYVTTENKVYEIVKRGVQKYEGHIIPVNCDMTPDHEPKCQKDTTVDATELDDAQRSLIARLEEYINSHHVPRERSEIAGNLQVLDTPPHEDTMRISMPIEAKIDDTGQKAKLALITLNLVEYKRTTSLIAGAASAAFASMIILLTYFWGATARSKKEYQEAFQKVARVMFKSPTPYLRLDCNDKIVDCSLSFCKKLGYPPTTHSVEEMQKHTLRSLCADQKSIEKYKHVQERRKNGKTVVPYPLKLKGLNDLVVSVIVRSAAIPSATKNQVPETFGILLEEDQTSTRPGEPPHGDADRGSNVRFIKR